MNLAKAMLTFLTVLEERSVTRAAEKLFLTPTAVSKQIKQLEAKFGQPLLTRTTRSMAVTDLGERFYKHCQQLNGDLEQARAFMALQQQEPQGKLRILCSHYFSGIFLTKHLYDFHKQYPRITLSVDVSDHHPDLNEETFDVMIGFRHLGKATAQLRQRKIQTSRFVLCAAPSYLKKAGTPHKPQDLLKHTLINHPARDPNNLIRFKDGTEIFMPPPSIIVNDFAVLLPLCMDGAGLLMVTELDAQPLLKKGKLIRVLPKHALEDFTIYAFYPQAPYEQPNVRCFLDFVLKHQPLSSI